jgi:periplasmic divalent cation tolerance protein
MIPALTVRIVLSTAGSADEAARIAHILVEERLAACVNIVPGVWSIYAWKGDVHDDQEWLLVIKTHLDRLEPLESRLTALHSYETPEFLVLVPESGSRAYLLWMDESLSQFVHKEPSSI